MHYHSSYKTTTETVAEYKAQLAKWERQHKYEQNIVCSVPERDIAVFSVEPTYNERWEPG